MSMDAGRRMADARRRIRRTSRQRARRAWQRYLREVAVKAEASAHVDPCPECGSTQLCLPDCWIAPWNIDQ